MFKHIGTSYNSSLRGTTTTSTLLRRDCNMSDYKFNPFIAKKYGINEAILIDSFIYWTRTNAAKKKNFHDDRYWFYGTCQSFNNFFIFFTPKQIKYSLLKLIKCGALVKGNYNKNSYDRTNWYSLSDSLLLELNLDKTCLNPSTPLAGTDLTNLDNGLSQIVLTIPTSKQPVKKDKPPTPVNPSGSVTETEKEFFETWNDIAEQEGFTKIRYSNREHIKKAKRELKKFLVYWPEVNSDPACHISPDNNMTPDYFRELILAAIAAKAFMLQPERDPYRTFDIILRQSNFEKILQEINARLR